MILTYHLRGDRPPQRLLCDALIQGAARSGDVVLPVEGYAKPLEKADGAILLGISGLHEGVSNRMVYDAYRKQGKRILLFDKGYTRKPYYRVSIDEFQPLHYFQKVQQPIGRLFSTGVKAESYSTKGTYLLLDGISQKYCDWHNLGPSLDWGIKIIDKIRTYSNLPIIYRLKKSTINYKRMRPMSKTLLSTQTLEVDMARALIVISHGGNLGWDATIAGKPHFAIGPSIARPISETDWEKVGIPHIPTDLQRQSWLQNVCYCQWTLDELAWGGAWEHIRKQML